MNDKLRRVARVVEKGLAPRWKPHLYWTSIWVHPGISRGLVSLDGTCATPAGLIEQCRRMAAGLVPD